MNLTGKMVKVRFKKYFPEQRLWIFIGKVLEMTENWIQVEGKGVINYHGTVKKAVFDEVPRVVVIPRENIAHIRILPDNFNLNKLEIVSSAMRDFIRVADGPDTSISEL